MTLFSAGQTPVTVGDIVQAIVILLVGWLLSRGIRATIRRVGPRESIGTEASVYAIGRLTHYTIVIVAVIIALTSIGLDFSNLAIVAGALSVGIASACSPSSTTLCPVSSSCSSISCGWVTTSNSTTA